MNAFAQMTWGQSGLAWLLISVCLFLMLIIMIQRGRGGGLAGAFGGAGGSSAFGAKTGDVFTLITVVVACLFVVLAVVANFVFDKTVQANTPVQVTAPDDAPADTPGESGKPVTTTTTIPITREIPLGPVQLPAKGGDAPDKQEKQDEGSADAPPTTGQAAEPKSQQPDADPSSAGAGSGAEDGGGAEGGAGSDDPKAKEGGTTEKAEDSPGS